MDNINELFEFIKKCPSPYHTVQTLKSELLNNGHTELFEGEAWNIENGKSYFVIRGGSSVIAFKARNSKNSFMIAASHSDSPAFKVKSSLELQGAYTRLDTERYGGMIHYSWLDRPLSIAGRVVIKEEDGISVRTVDVARPIAVIPSVAIHFNRSVNDGYKFNPTSDLLALVGDADSSSGVMDEIAAPLGVSKEKIISHDLFLYNADEGKSFGIKDEFIVSPRLDNLVSVFASYKAYFAAEEGNSIPVLAVFDSEEVGSLTQNGAESGFLFDTLSRIAGSDYTKMIANSFLASVDNAHAIHPNHPELSDAKNAPVLNGGIAVKWNAMRKYTTDAVSDAIFKTVCERVGVKVQSYSNRQDIPGGSTLGAIANASVPAISVDIGIPQLAMHSASETAGREDVSALIKALTELYSSSIVKSGDKISISKEK